MTKLDKYRKENYKNDIEIISLLNQYRKENNKNDREIISLLDQYRKEIDKIDKEILSLIKKRSEIVYFLIGPHKKKEKIASIQPKRHAQQLMQLTEFCDKKLIPKKLIKKIWTIIHQHSINLQK